VHLTPREEERLLVASAAHLARRRLARGARLGATEAIALLCDEVCEWAWDGMPLEEVVGRARTLLGVEELLPGVAELVPEVQIEALFPHGTVLVHVPRPFGEPDAAGPGAVKAVGPPVVLAPGRERRAVMLRNHGARTVWVSSHFPLDELNRAVSCEPQLPRGYRLDLASGEAVSLSPGESRRITAVSYSRLGDRQES
jgi:urease subunit gamma/beta